MKELRRQREEPLNCDFIHYHGTETHTEKQHLQGWVERTRQQRMVRRKIGITQRLSFPLIALVVGGEGDDHCGDDGMIWVENNVVFLMMPLPHKWPSTLFHVYKEDQMHKRPHTIGFAIIE